MFELTNRTVLVTGSATGLGQGISLAMAKQGARVILSDLPEASLDESRDLIRRQTGKECLEAPVDVRDLAQVERVTARILSEIGRVDILVNNAGINRPKPLPDIDAASWAEHYETNARGGFFLAQKLAPAMAEAGWGRIIWIASQSGLIGIPAQPMYASSKGAAIQLVRSLAGAWARQGVTVNAIAPSIVETNLTRRRLQSPEFRDMILRRIPAGRLVEVEHVAAAAVFLASNESALVNGHALCIDGGWSACLQ
jgi:2-deoxy-D-gluconate 3-dehydrogenase